MSHSRNLSRIISIFTLLALSVVSGITVSPVSAASIVVNSLADALIDDGLCTLREAIIAANTDAPYLGCSAGSGEDTIVLPEGIYTLGSQLPNITSQIVINGSNATNTVIQASECNPITAPGGCTPADYRVFRVNTGSGLRINQVTVRHGKDIVGGAIHNFGTLIVANSIISENFAGEGGGIAMSSGLTTIIESTLANNKAFDPETGGGWGAGISNYKGLLFIEDSTLINNTTPNNGGGIFNRQGTLSISGSTLANNAAGWGGGILNSDSNNVTIDSSTFSENTAENQGGGIYTDGNITVTNSTFSGNTANTAGGIFANSGTVNLESSTLSENGATFYGGMFVYSTLNFSNTIIANSVNSQDCGVWTEGTGSIGTNTHNLVMDGTCSAGGTDFVSGDPLLGPLADNGGLTQTHALLADSPAKDSGNCTSAPIFDQRGEDRPIGLSCDRGAFEFNPAKDAVKLFFLPLILW